MVTTSRQQQTDWSNQFWRFRRSLGAALAGVLLIAGALLAPLSTAAPVTAIYSNGFANGWSKPQYGSGNYTAGGGAPIELDFGGYNYAMLVHAPIDSQQTLRFQLRVANGLDAANQQWYVEVLNREAPSSSSTARGRFVFDFAGKQPNAAGYYQFSIDLGPGNLAGLPIDTMIFQAGSLAGPGLAAGTVGQLNNIELDGTVLPKGAFARIGASSSPTAESRIASIACTPGRTAINPNIYGIAMYRDYNSTNGPELASIGATSRRWGGNSTSRYNSAINASNTASDWYFQNFAKPVSMNQFIAQSAAAGKTNALTVPAIDWIAKDTTSYSFPKSAYSSGQSPQAVDPYWPDKTNGVLAGTNNEFIQTSPQATSEPNSPAKAAAFVSSARGAAVGAGKPGSITQYIIDNEPDGWATTHRDVRRNGIDPGYVSYEELVQISKDYAAAIRTVDPNAQIAGPALMGYVFQLFSPRDVADPTYAKTDFDNHAKVEYLKWYIQQIKNTPQRTIDIIDVHHYPAWQNDVGGLYPRGNLTLPTFQRRIDSVRSLWDPNYTDNDYIGQGQIGASNKNPQVIPRIRGWINDAYGTPDGLGVSIGEWNFGQEDHMSGAIATSEALGVFGRERITSAYYWTVPPENSPSYWGFRAFTNYDGNGGRFLPYGLTSSNAKDGTDPVSVFASSDSASGEKEITAVVINKSADRRISLDLRFNGCAAMNQATTYRYDGTNSTGFAASPAVAVANNTTALTLEPWSITVLRLSANSVPDPQPTTVPTTVAATTVPATTLVTIPPTAPTTKATTTRIATTVTTKVTTTAPTTAPTTAATTTTATTTATTVRLLRPVNLSLPAISGTLGVGSMLTASDGTWSNQPTSFTYRWQRCRTVCSNISGATGRTYVPTSSDRGRALKVFVTARNPAGSTRAVSANTASLG